MSNQPVEVSEETDVWICPFDHVHLVHLCHHLLLVFQLVDHLLVHKDFLLHLDLVGSRQATLPFVRNTAVHNQPAAHFRQKE